jgi:hypothetical protein
VAANARSYLIGSVDGFLTSNQNNISALRSRLIDVACSGQLDDEGLISLGYIGMEHPELLTDTTLECAISGHEKEGPVLWSLLDAWSRSGMSKPAIVASIEATATDPQTIRRLMPIADQIAARYAARANKETQEEQITSPKSPRPMSLSSR